VCPEIPWILLKVLSPREKPQPGHTLGSRLLAGVHINPSPDKKRSTKANHTQKVAGHTGCQVSENELVAQVVRQFIEANRAPKEAGKDF
jgi:putative transposase